MKVWVFIFCSCTIQLLEAPVVQLYLKEINFTLRSETIEYRILREGLAMSVVTRIVLHMQI